MEFIVKGALEKLFKDHGIERLYTPQMCHYAYSISIVKRGMPPGVVTAHLENLVRTIREFDGCTHGHIKVEETLQLIRVRVSIITPPDKLRIYHHVTPTVTELIHEGRTHPPRLFQ